MAPTWRRRGCFGLWSLGAVILAACGNASDVERAEDEYADRIAGEGTSTAEVMGPSWSEFEDLREAGVVAIANVTDVVATEDRIDGDYEGGPNRYWEDFTFEVEEVLGGLEEPRDRYLIRFFGFEEYDGERRNIVVQGTDVAVGDRVLVAINPYFETGLTGQLMTLDAVLFLAGGEVVDTERHNHLIEDLEKLSEAELFDRVRDLLATGPRPG